MNLSRYISERWFTITLFAYMLFWVVYWIATDPGPRPLDRVEPVAVADDVIAELGSE